MESLRVRTSPSAARERVFERDRGVCARCGLDTVERMRRLRNLRRRRYRPELLEEARTLARGFESAIEIGASRPRMRIHRTLWQADHILPVVEGGGGCGLENLRTLCLPCHRAETAELSRRRVAARRRIVPADAVELFLGSD